MFAENVPASLQTQSTINFEEYAIESNFGLDRLHGSGVHATYRQHRRSHMALGCLPVIISGGQQDLGHVVLRGSGPGEIAQLDVAQEEVNGHQADETEVQQDPAGKRKVRQHCGPETRLQRAHIHIP